MIVYVGKPDDVPCDFARRIVATVLTQLVHARQTEVEHSLCRSRGHVPTQVNKLAMHVLTDAPKQPLRIAVDGSGERLDLIDFFGKLLGVDPD